MWVFLTVNNGMAQMSTVSFNNEKKNIRETCLRSKRCENFKQLIFVKCTLPEILEFRKKKKNSILSCLLIPALTTKIFPIVANFLAPIG